MSAWDDAKVHRLMALRDKGFSAMEIGKALGVSRNAVIGKLARMGLGLKGRQSVKARGGRPRKHRRAKPSMPQVTATAPQGRDLAAAEPAADTVPPEPALEEEATPGPEPAAQTPAGARHGVVTAVMSLTPRSCRWPIGEPKTDPDFRFCGAERKRGAYCETHAAIAAGTAPADLSVPRGPRRKPAKQGALFFRSRGQ